MSLVYFVVSQPLPGLLRASVVIFTTKITKDTKWFDGLTKFGFVGRIKILELADTS